MGELPSALNHHFDFLQIGEKEIHGAMGEKLAPLAEPGKERHIRPCGIFQRYSCRPAECKPEVVRI